MSEKRKDMQPYLLLLLLVSAFVLAAILIKRCMPDKDQDEFLDTYLEEMYDGLDKYDPV